MIAKRLLFVPAIVATIACTKLPPGPQIGGEGAVDPNAGDATLPSDDVAATALDARVIDYGEALRTASIKLLQTPPPLAQILDVTGAKDQKAAYAAAIDAMLADPRFAVRMIDWWKDVFRTGGAAPTDPQDLRPSRDTAATLAARAIVEGRPFTEVLTSPSDNCPIYDADAQAFAPGECGSNAPVEAGVLTNPGVQMQFYSNMAMRRVRWVQEVFVCTKFPAEVSSHPKAIGKGQYTSPWPFASVSADPIDFQSTSSVICANCHTTINHLAPLFGHFDYFGKWSPELQVVTPVSPQARIAVVGDWLAAGEKTAWRHGEPVADFAELGRAMAADPDVAACMVTRAYNFAFSKEDVVGALATVPPEVIDPWIADFHDNGMNLKRTLRALFNSDDFVKF